MSWSEPHNPIAGYIVTASRVAGVAPRLPPTSCTTRTGSPPTGLFRGSQAAVAGRKADVDAPGQFGNGQVPVLLQFTNGRHTGQGMAAHLDRCLRPERITGVGRCG
jgi:hypothetical protein